MFSEYWFIFVRKIINPNPNKRTNLNYKKSESKQTNHGRISSATRLRAVVLLRPVKTNGVKGEQHHLGPLPSTTSHIHLPVLLHSPPQSYFTNRPTPSPTSHIYLPVLLHSLPQSYFTAYPSPTSRTAHPSPTSRTGPPQPGKTLHPHTHAPTLTHTP